MTKSYSQHFQDKVKKTYPDDTRVHEALGKNEMHLGIILKNASEQTKSGDIVLTSTIEAIREKAASIKANIELYNLWHDETKHWH